jgi:uncharacterized protein YicC (UPF0701 family)
MLRVFMVRSMTGFGRAEVSGDSIAVTVEARSVNHRHLDVALRLPRTLTSLELDARRLIQGRLERGRVDVTVQVTPLGGAATQRVQVDTVLAREYLTRARELADTAVDESRIVTEAAIWADKADVTEELARLRAHLAEFTLALDKGGPVGRALDFLIQELNREVNTVGSKADDLELSQAALAAKSVLEKIREQVQNLE